MYNVKSNKKEVSTGWIWLFFAVFAMVVLLFASTDSYLYQYVGVRADSAIFYMSGKAWMEGLLPYVDFSDSKGPMLWIIYGVGYLLSRTDMTGVFWLSCLAYAFTYFLAYLTTHQFLRSQGWSVVCAAALTLFFFFPMTHNEVRAEDFCLPFIMLALYAVCRLLDMGSITAQRRSSTPTFIGRSSAARPSSMGTGWCGLILGICFGACLMIKYNIAAMLFGFFLFGWLCAWLRGGFKECCKMVGMEIAGALLVVLPFVVYLWTKGCFEAFIQGYFIDAFLSVFRSPTDTSYLYWPVAAWSMLCALSVALWVPRWRLFPAISCLFFCAILLRGLPYYLSPLSVFTLFGLISFARLFSQRVRLGMGWAVALSLCFAALFVAVNWKFDQTRKPNARYYMRWEENKYRDRFYAISDLMGRMDKPKILYWGAMDFGQGIPCKALPACRYWTRQNGETEAMAKDQRACVENKQADFVLVSPKQTAKRNFLQRMGYKKHDFHTEDDFYPLLVYSRE